MSSATWQRLSSREEFESRTLAPLKLPNIRLNELAFPSPPSTPNSIQLSPSCSFQSVSWSRRPSVDSDYFSGALSGLSITSSVSSAGLDLKRKAGTTNLDTRPESSMRSLLEPQQQQLSLPPISHILNAVPSPFEHQLSQHRPQTSSGHASPRFAVPFPQGMFTPLPSPTCSISSSSTFPSQAQRSQPPSLPRSYSVPDVCYENLSASLSMTSPQKKRQASTTFESGLSSRFSVHAKKLQVRPSKSHRTTSRSSPYEGAAVLHRSSGSERKSSTCSSTSMSSSSSSSPCSPGPATDDETSEVPDEETSATSNNNNSNNNNSKGKKQNIQYTPEQNLFIIYHKDDLELPWAEIEKRYNARFPGLYRTAGGLNCNYYRLNAKLPRTEDSDKFSLIFDERPRYDPENPGKMLPLTWDEYEGVRFQTVHVQVRQAAKLLGHPIGLMWRCPEELVKGENEWVLEEHRVKARELAARRRYQREAWKRSQQLQQQHQQQQEQQYNQQHHQQTHTFKAEQFR